MPKISWSYPGVYTILEACEVNMSDGIRDPRNSSANIIPLGEFLQDANPSFRKAVIKALAQEGFETEESLPNLQLAGEILDAIDWLESHGYGNQWSRFETALRAADKRGILVDLTLFADASR
jgi:hypothetical protein